MNIQSVRAELRRWLSEQIRIDKFDADPPRQLTTAVNGRGVPANTCIQYPVKALSFQQLGLNTIRGRGLFTSSVVYRFPNSLRLDDLPLEKLEGVVQYLHGKALLTFTSCGPIVSAQPEEAEYPLQVSRDETDQNDWLVYTHLSLWISFSLTEFDIDPDYGPTDKANPVEIDDLNIRTYRADPGIEDSTLDANLTIN